MQIYVRYNIKVILKINEFWGIHALTNKMYGVKIMQMQRINIKHQNRYSDCSNSYRSYVAILRFLATSYN